MSVDTSPILQNEILPEILFITTYPPRECGVATYSHDLIKVLNNKFNQSFSIKICAIESNKEQHNYNIEDGNQLSPVDFILNVDQENAFSKLSDAINANDDIKMVVIQHEFGFFINNEVEFIALIHSVIVPVIIVFHTVLALPDSILKTKVLAIAKEAISIIVMTRISAGILTTDYEIPSDKILVIEHGTHLVQHVNREILKAKYQLLGKKVLSTFGLLSSGKSIETTLKALPNIIEKQKNVLFLIIGKTHPSILSAEGETYRNYLTSIIKVLDLQDHVQFINQFLPLPTLLEYLQLTDIYLFTSNDPNQAVSGTFSYAISCGCPIISTPIPHAREVLQSDAGIIIDFNDSKKLSNAVVELLENNQLRKNISLNALHRMASTAWENSAIAHAMLFEKISHHQIQLQYNFPSINLDHVKKMTTKFGIIQFSVINQPDLQSGYTLDDNARALVAICQHLQLTKDKTDIVLISRYYHFINFCQQSDGSFLNYIDEDENFTIQNNTTNLADSNGRAIWALGYLISLNDILPEDLIAKATVTFEKSLVQIKLIHSTRAMAFSIKGLYYANKQYKSANKKGLIVELANRLVQMYRHEATKDWLWFESYLTYANSILSEALLCAWLETEDKDYKEIAQLSFDFLLSKIFKSNNISVISNRGWMHKNEMLSKEIIGGEQPIDVAYTIIALKKFTDVFPTGDYQNKKTIAFNWFLGANHLNQIIYNPCTGGCYDGLEENYVNLNQGAESTVSYLMARLTMEEV